MQVRAAQCDVSDSGRELTNRGVNLLGGRSCHGAAGVQLARQVAGQRVVHLLMNLANQSPSHRTAEFSGEQRTLYGHSVVAVSDHNER